MVKCGNVERKEPGSSHFKIWSVSDSKLVLDYRVEYVQCSRWESCLEMPGTLNRAPVSTFVTLTSLGYHRGVSLQLEVSVGAMSSLTSHQQGGSLACLCFGFCFVENTVPGQVREWGYLVVFTDYLAVHAGWTEKGVKEKGVHAGAT